MSPSAVRWVRPDWPAPATVCAGTTLRQGGVSASPWDSLNLAMHVGDDPAAVVENRRRLNLPAEPVWLDQVHGNRVIDAGLIDPGTVSNGPLEADGAVSHRPGVICAVLTADCLPVLLCDRAGQRVAALHAGWRGLAAGILEAGVTALAAAPAEVLAWLGPAIGPQAYEIGAEVRRAFLADDPAAAVAFTPSRPGHWHMDIYALARRRLRRAGVTAVYGGDHCTFTESRAFYSWRRDGTTGRMASVIWRTA